MAAAASLSGWSYGSRFIACNAFLLSLTAALVSSVHQHKAFRPGLGLVRGIVADAASCMISIIRSMLLGGFVRQTSSILFWNSNQSA